METNHSAASSILILHAEDSPGDRLLIQKVLNEARYSFKITHANDGEEVLDYLNQRGKFSDASKPDLIIMDLHMPRRSGFEVIPEIKANSEFQNIPLIVLSSSARDHNLLNPYNPETNIFILKPNNLEGFKDVGSHIETFWESLNGNSVS